MAGPADSVSSDRFTRLDAGVAFALLAGACALYLATLCRGIYWYDSAEYVTAAVTLGVPHPPGYPLYTLLAHAFTWLPLPPALAVNAMSACFAGLAVALCYACARALGAGPGAAAAAAALLASGPSFWLNATIAEVYAPGLCVSFGVLLLLLRAQARAEPRLCVLAAALAGAGMGVHYSVASLGLGFAWLAARPALGGAPERRARRVLGLLAQCALAACAAYLAAFAYVLLRSGAESAVPNEAHPFGWPRLLWLLSGGNYRLWLTAGGPAGARALHVLGLLRDELGWGGGAFALLGIGLLARRAPALGLALALCVLGNLAFFLRYRVDDLQVFLLPSVALLCTCAGVGAAALGRGLQQLAPARLKPGALPAWLLGALVGVRLWTGYPQRDLSAFSQAQDYAQRLAVQLPYRAVILNYTTPEEWKYDAVFGMYFQHVLGGRRDVVVVANADRPVLNRLLAEQRPTYLYAPVAHVAREYRLVREGELYRLVARVAPASGPE